MQWRSWFIAAVLTIVARHAAAELEKGAGLSAADTGVAGPLPKFVVVAGFGGSGTRAAAMMLDKAGVFMASGGLGCDRQWTDSSDIPYSACMRTSHDKDQPCSDEHMDWHFSRMKLAHRSGGKQGFCPNFTTPLPPGDAKKISQVYRSIVNRARTCTEGCKHDSTVEPNRWKGSNITAVGLKDASTLLAMTALHEWASLTGVELYVVMVIRDGRDLVLGASDGAHDSLERAMGSLDDAGGFHGDAYRVHAWAQSYKQRHECMQPTLGAHLVPMRMEDFAVNETNARKAAAAQLLLSLHVPFDDAKLDELSAVMAVPIDAPADFLSSHYGRWEQVLKSEEAKKEFFDAAKPAFDAFGYQIGEQYRVTGVDLSAELPELLARSRDTSAVPSGSP